MAKAGKKKGKAKKKPQARVHLREVSHAQQQALMRDVNKLLAARGIVGKIAEMRIGGVGAATIGDCPPGTTKQVVCRKQPDGTVVCSEECV